MAAVLVDAGALIALLDKGDHAHPRAVAALKSIRAPLATVWPAITEAMHLLSDLPPACEAILDMLDDGHLAVLALDRSDVTRMKELMRQYRDLPMDFADAALVRVAEREQMNRILTFDAHFHVYRPARRGRFVVLPD